MSLNVPWLHELQVLVPSLRETVRQLRTDPQVLKFHLGETTTVPDYCIRLYNEQMGRYAEIMPIGESGPFLELEQELDVQEINISRSHLPPAVSIAQSEGVAMPVVAE